MSGFLKKIKKRRILIVSAGGLQGGLQCCYVTTLNDTWEMVAHSFTPYPQKIAALLERFITPDKVEFSLQSLSWLDYRLSLLYSDCAKALLARLPTSLRSPHCIVLNKTCLWKGPTGEEQQQTNWNIALGDAQHLAATLKSPVMTDFVRQQCIAGGEGFLPTHSGDLFLASPLGGTVVFINIGLISHMTIIDTPNSKIIIDSDTGPGTCCVNTLMKTCEARDGPRTGGFDRDGTLAQLGTVHGDSLKTLSEDPWFQKPGPKRGDIHHFNCVVMQLSSSALSNTDLLATITALTARTIYDFFRRESKNIDPGQPVRVMLSGGGSNNQTLLHYLKTYFDTIPVTTVEDLGIPLDMRVPLALGLTVNRHLAKSDIPWKSGDSPFITSFGRWVFP